MMMKDKAWSFEREYDYDENQDLMKGWPCTIRKSVGM